MSAAAIAGISLVICSCGRVSGPVGPRSSGDLEIQVQLPGVLGKKAAALRTAFDSLVVEVAADDMAALRFTRAMSGQQPLVVDTLSGIPAGSARRVSISTVDRNGVTTHVDSMGVRTLRIDPDFTTVLQVVLLPVRGSIYLQVGGVPTDVDSLGAVFTSNGGDVWAVSVARSPKVFLSIDGIPADTRGTLRVAGFTAGGDTLYSAQSEVVVNARSTNGIQLSFESTPGQLVLSGTLELPGAVVVSASMGNIPAASDEQGTLFFTEIMYAANDSEYVEVYNPAETDAYYDSLYLDIDGTRRLFTGISIPAESYYVIGRKEMPWVDAAHSVASALDLSGKGNWLTLLTADLRIIDQVIFTGGTNSLEWPKISGKSSICLVADAYGAQDNNYGRNWVIAEIPINGAPSQMGTPHTL